MSFIIDKDVPVPAITRPKQGKYFDTLKNLKIDESFGANTKTGHGIYHAAKIMRERGQISRNYRLRISPDPLGVYTWRVWRVE